MESDGELPLKGCAGVRSSKAEEVGDGKTQYDEGGFDCDELAAVVGGGDFGLPLLSEIKQHQPTASSNSIGNVCRLAYRWNDSGVGSDTHTGYNAACDELTNCCRCYLEDRADDYKRRPEILESRVARSV